MKAFAYSSGFFPLNDIDAAVNLTGSRMPMWQDSQRSTMLALPIKIAIRLLFHIKYVWITPWFNV